MNARIYTGAALIAIAGLLFFLVAMPMYDDVQINRNALDDRTTLLEGRAAIIQNVKDLTKQYADHATDIQKFGDVVPAQKSVAEIISAIQTLATQNGVQLTTLSIVPVQNQNQASFNQQSVNIGVNGNYPNFKSFLTALEQNIRVIDITSMDASPTTDGSSVINFQMRGFAYYLQ